MIKPAFIPCRDARGWRRYYPRRPTLLYYVKFSPIKGKPFYKIGITTQSVKQRFAGERTPYEILYTKQYSGGQEAYREEQRVLKEYVQHLIPMAKLLKSGNGELFSVDIRIKGNK